MECSNCNFILFEQEEDFFICPRCGEIIESNIGYSNLSIEEIQEDASYYVNKKKKFKEIKWELFAAIPFIYYLAKNNWSYILGSDVRYHYGAMDYADFYPPFAFLLLYSLLSKSTKLTRFILGDRVWYLSSKVCTILKIPLYIILTVLIFKIDLPSQEKVLWAKISSTYITHPKSELISCISSIMNIRKIFIVVTMFAFIVFEIMDMHIHYLLLDINEQ